MYFSSTSLHRQWKQEEPRAAVFVLPSDLIMMIDRQQNQNSPREAQHFVSEELWSTEL